MAVGSRKCLHISLFGIAFACLTLVSRTLLNKLCDVSFEVLRALKKRGCFSDQDLKRNLSALELVTQFTSERAKDIEFFCDLLSARGFDAVADRESSTGANVDTAFAHRPAGTKSYPAQEQGRAVKHPRH